MFKYFEGHSESLGGSLVQYRTSNSVGSNPVSLMGIWIKKIIDDIPQNWTLIVSTLYISVSQTICRSIQTILFVNSCRSSTNNQSSILWNITFYYFIHSVSQHVPSSVITKIHFFHGRLSIFGLCSRIKVKQQQQQTMFCLMCHAYSHIISQTTSELPTLIPCWINSTRVIKKTVSIKIVNLAEICDLNNKSYSQFSSTRLSISPCLGLPFVSI